MIADLVAAGANPDWEGPGRFTSLFFNSILSDDNDEILAALIAAGANLNYRKSKTAATPLLFAAALGKAKNMATLVRLGADVDAREDGGTGVVHALALCDREAAIRESPWLSPLIDQRDATGQTPLMIAAVLGKTGTIAALLDAGANPALTDEDGLSAMDYADLIADPELRTATQALLRGVRPESAVRDYGESGGK